MFSTNKNMQSILGGFRLDDMMRYSQFVPRLYNLCLSLGFEAGHIMPSRAFCSDENQGFPIILIAKHFGAFPFNHGQVGGIVATDRHGPHAGHGKDMVIIQASHVGYDPETATFGSYCRLQTVDNKNTSTCGKIAAVLRWYQDQYRFAQDNIKLCREGNVCTIRIDNQLLDERCTEGLILNLDRMVSMEDGKPSLQRTLSTSRVFIASDECCQLLPESEWPSGQGVSIGRHLGPDMFFYRRDISGDIEGRGHMENGLFNPMPWIVTSDAPLLVAAQVGAQVEFDRAFRTIAIAPEYRGRKLLFISCLNIDISPKEGQFFPLTKCVPWAAYFQDGNGGSRIFEQYEIIEQLLQQSAENPDQVDLEDAIHQMIDAHEIKIVT
jgi:hypothetical protein